MTAFVGHLLLFALLGIGFLIAPLILGFLVRPRIRTPEKDAVYECGEPTIGSSYVQFDIRFYVVALLFIIFDVEVAFFFPWTTIYGGSMQLADTRLEEGVRVQLSERLLSMPEGSLNAATAISPEAALNLGLTGLVDILVFFGVLLVGFAYVWKRGDLDWVRAVAQQIREAKPRPKVPPIIERPRERQPVG